MLTLDSFGNCVNICLLKCSLYIYMYIYIYVYRGAGNEFSGCSIPAFLSYTLHHIS